jgi:hypothetical protein
MSILEAIEITKLSQRIKCWWCGTLFQKGSIWSDSNKNGVELAGFKEKQLLFLHCTNCDNNTSLTKIVAY